MGQPKIRIHNGSGGMDKDTDPILADGNGNAIYQPNDYYDALNMRPKSQTAANSFGNEVILGNGLKVCSVGSVTDQTEVARIYMDEGAVSLTLQYFVYDSNGVEAASGNHNFGGAATYDDVYTWFSSALSVAFPDATFTHGSTIPYFDMTFVNSTQRYTIVSGYLVDGSTVFDYPEFIITQDFIDVGGEKYLVPIASVDIANGNGSDTFILSTTDNEDGVGELGVITYNGVVYTYTRLLRSSELKLGWLYLPDLVGEKSNGRVNLYWVDGHNYDRAVYFFGDYSTDGCINFVDPNNIYYYGSIDLGTRQQKFASTATLTFTSQEDSGGALTSGDKRYFLAFVDYSGQISSYSMLGQPIPVSPAFWYGGTELQSTTKSNVFTVSGADPLIFPYVRLGVVNYANTAVSIQLLPQISTTANDFTLYHTGFEVAETVQAGALSLELQQIINSFNNVILNQRYVKSNITTVLDYDFTNAFAALTLSTARSQTDYAEDPYQTSMTLTHDGNYDPLINSKLGYMDNETYRIGGRVEFKNGGITPCFLIGDITIDISDSGEFPYGGSLTTFNSGPESFIINRAIKVSGWTDFWLALPNGITEADIERVHIMRVPCVPEVLATGLGMASVSLGNDGTYDYYAPGYLDSTGVGSIPLYNTYSREKKYIHFITPDTLFTNGQITYVDGDKVNFYEDLESLGGSPITINGGEIAYGDAYRDVSRKSVLFQYSGYNNGNTAYTPQDLDNAIHVVSNVKNPKEVTADPIVPFGSGDKFTITGNDVYECNLIVGETISAPDIVYYNGVLPSTLLVFTSDLGALNWGKYIQYIRPLVNKYGDYLDNSWIWTGYAQSVGSTADLDVLGGDVFIQKTTLRLSTIDSNSALTNANCAFGFFSQNRVNTTMRATGGIPAYVDTTNNTWSVGIGKFMELSTNESYTYQSQYTPRNQEQSYVSYNPNYLTPSTKETRIIWSTLKPIGSLLDYYLEFQALNFRDLDLTDGRISHMAILNGELWTWQQRRLMQQVFNNDGIVSSDTSSLLIGDGSVMSRRGMPITRYGTNQKWGVKIGRSRGGDDVAMWWSEELKSIIKIGAEGTNVVSDGDKISIFIQPACELLTVADNTTLDWGNNLRGVYDHKNHEFVWTVVVALPCLLWSEDTSYLTNDLCFLQNANTAFDGGITVYRATEDNLNSNPLDRDSWTEVENGYIAYTLCYSLIKNKFTSFYGYRPKLYIPKGDSFLTPAPIEINQPLNTLRMSEIFKHDSGRAACFYETKQVATFGLDLLVNDSDPYRLDCNTIGTFLTNSNIYRYQIYVIATDTYWAIREVSTDYVILYDEYTGADIMSGEAHIILCWGEEPYIEFMDNDDPYAYKRPHAVNIQSSTEPIRVEFTNLTQQSFITNRNENNSLLTDFSEVDDVYRSGVHNDTTATPTDNTGFADRLKSPWWKSKVFFRVGNVSRIHQLISKFGVDKRNIS